MGRIATGSSDEVGGSEQSLLADALLGGCLPSEAEYHLTLAGKSYHLDEVAEQHLQQAMSIAPDHAAVLIGHYRYYFYKGRLEQALEIARLCVSKALTDNGLDTSWRQVRAGDAEFGSFEAVLPRFFLFSLKGYAYLNLRLGHIEEGTSAVHKLLELDPSDRIGARVLLDVAERAGREDDD